MAKIGGATKKRMFLLLFRFDPNGERPSTRCQRHVEASREAVAEARVACGTG
ncbi:hypothetical protein PVK06_009178 [Gossypium arboreum]|uniref:Uncharacterized protein n=1 Tax=Gossypium arboreum TaxID=29729 RepID=A0ABR0QLS1_GOSAR|nr:hypothetical protein PVK06_009178 [Gossypium arboreum]